MKEEMEHVIEITEEGERSYWECDCGAAGSYSVDSEWATPGIAERHVPEGEMIGYRKRTKEAW